MPKRVQSPSSINTYKQCPRKYYYQYILKLPTKPSIHLIRGSIVHTVLEDFFKKIPLADVENYQNTIKTILQNNLVIEWKKNETKLKELKLTEEQLFFYFDETINMILNFAEIFNQKLNDKIKKGLNFSQAFKELCPISEEKFVSEKYQVMGYIDAIEKRDDGFYIMDYKTSKGNEINETYKLQLSIYTLLFYEKYNTLPKKVGIFFLKNNEKFIDASLDLVKNAEFEIEQIHLSTEADKKEDYPMKPSGLCKWSTGQCDFYEKCFPNGRF
jgi:putative RecB family exonuclease